MALRHSLSTGLVCACIATLANCASGKPAAVQPAPGTENISSRIAATELAGITDRGRRLAAYDVVAWHATDAVQALSPTAGSVTGYVARETSQGWEVAFGRSSVLRDTFYVFYLARERVGSDDFAVTPMSPAVADTGYSARAFRATRVALDAFGTPKRPYNVAVLPAESGAWWVYLTPAPTHIGVWPLGADVRFRVDSTGRQILERRQLHNAVIEYDARGKHPDRGMHSAVLADRPEDTDVMLVLRREPRIPEYIVTETFIFRVNTDGTITAFDRYVQGSGD